LVARGKNVNQVVVAIAREMAAFVWAIAREVAVAHWGSPSAGPTDGSREPLSTSSEQRKSCSPGVAQPSLRVMRLEEILVPRAEAGAGRTQVRW